MPKMTRHEKKQYYAKQILEVLYKYYDFGDQKKYYGNNKSFEKLQTILHFTDGDNKIEHVIHMDSKLSALRNGFIRTIKRIDELDISFDKKQKTFYDLIDLYYAMHINLITQMDTIMRDTKRSFDPEKNEDAYVYQTKLKTRKVKLRK